MSGQARLRAVSIEGDTPFKQQLDYFLSQDQRVRSDIHDHLPDQRSTVEDRCQTIRANQLIYGMGGVNIDRQGLPQETQQAIDRASSGAQASALAAQAECLRTSRPQRPGRNRRE